MLSVVKSHETVALSSGGFPPGRNVFTRFIYKTVIVDAPCMLLLYCQVSLQVNKMVGTANE